MADSFQTTLSDAFSSEKYVKNNSVLERAKTTSSKTKTKQRNKGTWQNKTLFET